MNNHLESYEMEEGIVTFNHATGDIYAEWKNGYSERWLRKNYTIKQKLHSFYLLTEQWSKIGYES